jgi:membrane-associated HD superfamily phosphohydrolase
VSVILLWLELTDFDGRDDHVLFTSVSTVSTLVASFKSVVGVTDSGFVLLASDFNFSANICLYASVLAAAIAFARTRSSISFTFLASFAAVANLLWSASGVGAGPVLSQIGSVGGNGGFGSSKT